MPAREQFESQHYTRQRFTPSTGLGHFDMDYDPRSGRMVVTVQFSSKYNEQYYGLLKKDHGAQPSEEHASRVKDRFVHEAAAAIPAQWNRKFRFVCTKQGFGGVVAEPEFVVVGDILPPGAHYLIELSDDPRLGENNPSAVVTELLTSDGAHRAQMIASDSTTAGGRVKADMAIADFVAGYSVPFSPDPRGADRRLAADRIRDFIRQTHLMGRYFNRQEHRWLVSFSGPLEQISDAVAWVDTLFDSMGLKTWVKFRPEPQPSGRGVTIRVALRSTKIEQDEPAAQHVELLKNLHGLFHPGNRRLAESYPDGQCFFEQNTIAHEFGHMLGLPDEYNCLSEAAFTTLRHLNFIETRDDFELQEWLKSQARDSAYMPHDPQVIGNQQKFLELCALANIRAPAFGQKNLSLMSAGTELREHHAVTLWECLTQLTRSFIHPNEWKITLQ